MYQHLCELWTHSNFDEKLMLHLENTIAYTSKLIYRLITIRMPYIAHCHTVHILIDKVQVKIHGKHSNVEKDIFKNTEIKL